MNRKNIVGLILCLLLFVASFALTPSGLAGYWDLAALLVVFSGLGAATLMAYPVETLRNAFAVARNAYGTKPQTPEEVARTLLDLSVRSRVDGVLSLERMEEMSRDTFLSGAVQCLVDNYKEDEIRDLLGAEMHFFALRRQQSERVFQTLARLGPAFGLAGSVIGIIGMIMGINDTAVILQNIPVAFISTLYGVVLGNLVFAPMAENIHHQTRAQLLNQQLVMEGVAAMAREQNPYKLERRLSAFLTPGLRQEQALALRGFARKHARRRQETAGAKEDAASLLARAS
jgi:chemotaxis protein MotA